MRASRALTVTAVRESPTLLHACAFEDLSSHFHREKFSNFTKLLCFTGQCLSKDVLYQTGVISHVLTRTCSCSIRTCAVNYASMSYIHAIIRLF